MTSHQPPPTAETETPQPDPALPSTGTSPKVLASLRSGVDYRTLWTGAAAGGAAYVFMYLVSLLLTAVIITATVEALRQPTWLAPGPAVPESYVPDAWAILGQLAAQLIPMAHLGSLSSSAAGSLPFLGAIRAEASASAVPLTLLAASLLSPWIAGRLAESRVRSTTRVQLWAQAVAAGGVFSVLATSIAALASVTPPPTAGFRAEPITAAGPTALLCAFVAATIMSWLGRRSVAGRQEDGAWRRTAANAIQAVGTYVAVFLIVAVPAALVTAGIKAGWLGLLSAPAWLLNVAGYMFVDGHLGGLHGSARVSQSTGNSTTSGGYFYGVAGTLEGISVPTWAAWLLVALSLASVIGSATLLLLRRGGVPVPGVAGWLPVPVSFAALGLAINVLLAAQLRIDVAGLFAADYSFAPTFWFPAVMACWGVLVEAASRYLGPYLLPYVPGRLRSALAPQHVHGTVDPEFSEARVTTGPVDEASPVDVRTSLRLSPTGGTQPPSQTSAEGPAVKVLTPQQRKRVLTVLISVLSAAVLLAGSFIAVNMVKAASGPDKLVQAYVQALIDGDADRALQIADPDIPEEDRLLLGNDVYAKAEKRIDGFSILSSTVTGDSAVVRAELRQAGRKSEVAYNLAKVNPELLDDHWRLSADATKAVSLTVDAAVEAVRVNGVEIPVTGAPDAYTGMSTISLPAFPGEYTLAPSAQEKYLTARDAKAFVTISLSQAPEGARLRTEANDTFRAEVARQVDGVLAACAASDKLSPEGCPFSTYAFGDVRGVKWSVTKKPSYQLTRLSDGSWRISGSTSGQATATYERNSSWDKDKPEWKPDSATDEFNARGTVSVHRGDLFVELSRY